MYFEVSGWGCVWGGVVHVRAGEGVLSDMYFAWFGRIKYRNCWGEGSTVKQHRKEEKWSFLRLLHCLFCCNAGNICPLGLNRIIHVCDE